MTPRPRWCALRINLVDPSRARQMRQYLSVRSLVMRYVQVATPSYLIGFDGTFPQADYDRQQCAERGPCGLVRIRAWLRCPIHH